MKNAHHSGERKRVELAKSYKNLVSGLGRGAAGLCVLAVVMLSCVSTDQTKSNEIQALKQEIEVGKAALAKVAGAYGVVHDRPATEYLNKMLKSLALYVGRQGLEYRAVILASEQVNAYSLPGGYVCVTLGALKKIQEPGELAGVLAHELGHINLRHILEHVKIETRKDFWETLAHIIAGSRMVITGAIDQINDQIAERLFLEGYAAQEEFQADKYAVELLQSVGIEAGAYAVFLTRLESATDHQDLENLDKTHPPLEARLAAMKSLLREGGRPLPHTAEFDSFMQIVSHLEAAQ